MGQGWGKDGGEEWRRAARVDTLAERMKTGTV